jgi:hypothetical protein
MEVAQKREPNVGDISDTESEDIEAKEAAREDVVRRTLAERNC